MNLEMEADFQAASRQFPELASMFDELRQVMAEVEQVQREEARRETETAEAEAIADEKRAERARNGDLGPDWQRIQRRIDEGKTTVNAIFMGEDSSNEARNLRKQAASNLSKLHDQWAKEAEDGKRANLLTEFSEFCETQEAYVSKVTEYIQATVNRHFC